MCSPGAQLGLWGPAVSLHELLQQAAGGQWAASGTHEGCKVSHRESLAAHLNNDTVRLMLLVSADCDALVCCMACWRLADGFFAACGQLCWPATDALHVQGQEHKVTGVARQKVALTSQVYAAMPLIHQSKDLLHSNCTASCIAN